MIDSEGSLENVEIPTDAGSVNVVDCVHDWKFTEYRIYSRTAINHTQWSRIGGCAKCGAVIWNAPAQPVELMHVPV